MNEQMTLLIEAVKSDNLRKKKQAAKRNREYSEQYAKSTNNCGDFELNVIDAFFENERGYQPREPKGRCKDCTHFMTNDLGVWCYGRDGCDKFEPRFEQMTLEEMAR